MVENKSRSELSENGKGDTLRPFSNHSGFLEEWDKIFGHKDSEIDFDFDILKSKQVYVCSHEIKIGSNVCSRCSKDIGSIQMDNESYTLIGG